VADRAARSPLGGFFGLVAADAGDSFSSLYRHSILRFKAFRDISQH
jgi:hypothetical protein